MNDSVYYPYGFNLYAESPATLKEKLMLVPQDRAILFYALEYVNNDSIKDFLSLIKDMKLGHRVYWWRHPSHDLSPEIELELGNQLYKIDVDLLNLDFNMRVENTSTVNPKWNANTGRFIFPTGKPNKANRIRLLYKLYTNGLLNHCDWSFFMNEAIYQASKKLLPELSDLEFSQFVKQHVRRLDACDVINACHGADHASGYPFDGSLYAQSSFRIISETMMLWTPIVSEKTWITILNRQPFMIAGYAKNLVYLKQAGYCTFENYLPIPEYDDIIDQEQRLEAVIQNTKFWLQNIHFQQDSIEQDIEHNYHHLIKNIDNMVTLTKQLARELNWCHKSIYQIVPLDIIQENWMLFYYRIKDDSWPDCLTESGFAKLPKHIQQECIDTFGYQPIKKI